MWCLTELHKAVRDALSLEVTLQEAEPELRVVAGEEGAAEADHTGHAIVFGVGHPGWAWCRAKGRSGRGN